MARQPTALVVHDLSDFTRKLARALAESEAPPGHVALQNIVARAAGHRNLQALKAAHASACSAEAEAAVASGAAPESVLAPARGAATELSPEARRALGHFDAEGRLVRWPAKFGIQSLILWPLWAQFDAKRRYSESEVNTILKRAHRFGDHATLRRELVNHKLLAREPDCSAYWKLPRRPAPETRAMLAAWRAQSRSAP